MNIIFNNELEREFAEQIKKAQNSIILLSAFLKATSLKWVDEQISCDLDVTIVTRWRIEDILTGASDLSAYKFASDKGWKFAINNRMHHKLYLFDNKVLIIGSPNLTNKGFHLNVIGNDESSVKIVPTNIDIYKLHNYLKQCCFLDDAFFEEMQTEVKSIEFRNEPISKYKWPNIITNKINKSLKNLWVDDLLFNSPESIWKNENEFVYHDLVLLQLDNIEELLDKERVSVRFKNTAIWRWLTDVIENSSSEFVLFGEITAKLHYDLIDDPKPYRNNVKTFVSNIFEWIKYLEIHEIYVKKFNRTEALYSFSHQNRRKN